MPDISPQEMSESALAAALRLHLEQTYGSWHAAFGTALTPEAWLSLLVQSSQGELQHTADIVPLARFAFNAAAPAPDAESAPELQTPYAVNVLQTFITYLSALDNM